MTSKGIVDALQKQNTVKKNNDIVDEIDDIFKEIDSIKLDGEKDKEKDEVLVNIDKLTKKIDKLNKLSDTNTNDLSDHKNVIKEILKHRKKMKDTLDNIEEIETLINLHHKKKKDNKENTTPVNTTDGAGMTKRTGRGYDGGKYHISTSGGDDNPTNVSTDTDSEIVSKLIDDIKNIQQNTTDDINNYKNIVMEYNGIVGDDKSATNTDTIFNISIPKISTNTLDKDKIKENAGRLDQLNNSAKELKKVLEKFYDENKKIIGKIETDFKSSVQPLLSKYYRGSVIASQKKKFKITFEKLKENQNKHTSTLKQESNKLFTKIAGYANQVSKDENEKGAKQQIDFLKEIKGRGFREDKRNRKRWNGGDGEENQDQLTILQNDLKSLKKQIEKTGQLKELGSEFGNINDIPDIYTEIYDRYLKKRQDAEMNETDENKKADAILKVDQEFLNDIEKHKLLPKYAYKINTTDRLLFIVLIVIIKVISITIIEYLIDNEILSGIIASLVIFTTIYLIIMTILLYLINNGGIYLKSLFGYAHLDVNKGGIMLHYVLMLMFLLAIFIIYVNMTINQKEESINTVEEKIELAHRVDMITNIIVVFCAIFVMVI
tara:strand:+ start:377 stop:2188 length:1812 start_codon:yes stop_codon:yes gene_type:complete